MAEEQPPEEKPSRKGIGKPLSAEDKALLLEMFKRPDLRREGGKLDIPTICRMTGFTYNQVTKFADKDPYIKAQKAEVNTDSVRVTENSLIDPAPSILPPTIAISKEDFEKYRALLRQESKLRNRDWNGLGMDGAMADRMKRLSETGRAPLLLVTEAMYGGLVKSVGHLDEYLEKVGEMISTNLFPDEHDKEGNSVEDGKKMREWLRTWYDGVKLLMDLNNSTQKNQAIMARMLLDMKKLGEDAKPPEKGVYEMPADSNKNGTAA